MAPTKAAWVSLPREVQASVVLPTRGVAVVLVAELRARPGAAFHELFDLRRRIEGIRVERARVEEREARARSLLLAARAVVDVTDRDESSAIVIVRILDVDED